MAESLHLDGDEITTGSEPKAVGEIAVDEDYGISRSNRVVEEPNSKGTIVATRTRTSWHPPMDRYFIDLMLEQVRKGNQIEGVFRKQSWAEMIASFNAKFGFNYDVDVLKNRYKTLRRQYNVIKNLLELNGFVWDDARQMVTADDYVWQDYVKVCIFSEPHKTCPCMILLRVHSTGFHERRMGFLSETFKLSDHKIRKNSRCILIIR